MEEFKSKHNLLFLSRIGKIQLDPKHVWYEFKIGTCHGLWTHTDDSYDILAIKNDKPHNGHIEDVFEWFERSCKRDGKALRFLETFMNQKFREHLLNKRNFQIENNNKNNLIKNF